MPYTQGNVASGSVQSERIVRLNTRGAGKGRYVLYWMQQSQRARCNHALQHAIEQADRLKLPVVVAFGLMDDYPQANLRHYRFMLEGLSQTQQDLAAMGIRMVVRRGNPPEVALSLAGEAALVVCDRGYLIHQRRWRDHLADRSPVRVVQVESDVVVPVEAASQKAEYAARTLRPRIARQLANYLTPLNEARPQRSSMSMRIEGDVDLPDIDRTLASLKLDRTIKPSTRFVGGASHAQSLLEQFISRKLNRYGGDRSEPSAYIVSFMSPYLHFGQIAPLEVALAVENSPAPRADRDAYLEELIVRRELACNYCQFTPDYWSYDALPAWARRSLEKHARDTRERTYSRDQLEACATDDPYWNAAMREMISTGYMHNYMRMYWGKRIIGWKATPRAAFDELLYLNNRYFIDGRDPSSYANVAWCFGLHDRPWQERPIFGQIRYMNRAGLERKFDMPSYIDAVCAMA